MEDVQAGPYVIGVKLHGGLLGNKGTMPLGEVEHARGCGMLPTLAGQLGLGASLARWSPNQLDLSGLVLDTKELGKQLSFQLVLGLSSVGHVCRLGLALSLL